MTEYTPITTSSFNGLYSRSDNTKVPYDHLLDCLNLKFRDGEFFTREGSVNSITLAGIKRQAVYKMNDEAPRRLLLDSTGKLFDATISLITPILNIAAMSDFSCVTLNNRCYITPHDGLTGLAGEEVYVYNGTGTARKAAGVAPTNAPIAADSATAGNVEVGIHLIAVAFVSDSGFISAISPPVEYTAPGSLSVDVSNIDTGPAGTASRRLVATKTLIIYDGDPDHQEYFFVPGGDIDDNVTTTKTINFFDADLVDSADYVIEQLSEIPAGVGIDVYNNRLMVWGSNANASLCYVSKAKEPESINAAEGFFEVLDGSEGFKNGFELRGLFYITKRDRTKVTQDNGENAAFWTVNDADLAQGCECHCVGKMLDKDGKNTLETVFVATTTGLYAFDGTYSREMISWKITKYWDRINKAAFHTVEVAVNPLDEEVCVAIPLDLATSPSHVLYCDYSKGLDSKDVRWCPWTFPVVPTSIIFDVDYTTKEAVFKYASTNVNSLDQTLRNDLDTAIDNYARFAYTGAGYSGQLNNIGSINAFIIGSGSAALTMYSLNDALTKTLTSWTLANPPAGYSTRDTGGFEAEKVSVKIRVNAVNSWMNVNEFTMFSKPVADARPNP
jgi:hypothetical protein